MTRSFGIRCLGGGRPSAKTAPLWVLLPLLTPRSTSLRCLDEFGIRLASTVVTGCTIALSMRAFLIVLGGLQFSNAGVEQLAKLLELGWCELLLQGQAL